jgi:hypothetical protein
MNVNVDDLPPVEDASTADKKVLAQVMCPIYFTAQGQPRCAMARVLANTDLQWVALQAGCLLGWMAAADRTMVAS